MAEISSRREDDKNLQDWLIPGWQEKGGDRPGMDREGAGPAGKGSPLLHLGVEKTHGQEPMAAALSIGWGRRGLPCGQPSQAPFGVDQAAAYAQMPGTCAAA